MSFDRRSLLASSAALLVSKTAFAQGSSAAKEAAAPGTTFNFRKASWSPETSAKPATNVPVFSINGQLPAPVIRLKLGEEVRLQVKNSLEVPALLNWHGVRLAGAQIGDPLTQPQLGPGDSTEIAFTPPDAGTFFYQPSSALLAQYPEARGLSGVLVVEETLPPPVAHDIVLALDDWPQSAQDAPLIVTGHATPVLLNAAPGARVRVRLVNLSTRAALPIGFNSLRPLVIAIDGQPCDPFEPARATLPLGPGARFDILCDLPREPGAASVVLRGETERVLALCKLEGAPLAETPAFTGLPANPLLPIAIHLEKAARADLVMEASAATSGNVLFNGTPGALQGKPIVSVKRGTAVSLGFINKTSELQPIRLHGHVMRLLHALDDGWEPYWRDTIIVPPGKTSRIAFVADNPGRWMVESAIAAQSAAGLWGWFDVK